MTDLAALAEAAAKEERDLKGRTVPYLYSDYALETRAEFLESVAAELRKKDAEVAVLRKALKGIEFSAYDETGFGSESDNLCPECRYHFSHDNDCCVGMALTPTAR